MNYDYKRIEYIINNTQILKLPKRKIATFGTTNVNYYLITELIKDMMIEIREGKITAENPLILPPPSPDSVPFGGLEEYQNSAVFSTFFCKYMRGLLYDFKFKNETEKIKTVYGSLKKTLNNIKERVDKEDKPIGIIKGVDAPSWHISLTKFLRDVVESSVQMNITELEERGFFEREGYEKIRYRTEKEVPDNLRFKVDQAFEQVKKGKLNIRELEAYLIRLGLYHIYRNRL